ncbi:hypothetical protein CEXT_752091 [Caerostris extrusa]|uniref:Uncharacterized protein n=1 Tax=Caerostris extrusa TaxID=172846 RepID=A0AAV4YC89_CAEEX|nr:hypothetical protein CEXT_752091 [Caerostris extrusa]
MKWKEHFHSHGMNAFGKCFYSCVRKVISWKLFAKTGVKEQDGYVSSSLQDDLEMSDSDDEEMPEVKRVLINPRYLQLLKILLMSLKLRL